MRRSRGVWWSLLGLALVAIPGFALGLFAGVLWEDPGLIVGDMAGETEEVAWGPQAPAAETVKGASVARFQRGDQVTETR